jgi:hypothetical protein
VQRRTFVVEHPESAPTNREPGSEDLVMRRPTCPIVDCSLAVGLALSVIGLVTAVATLNQPGDVVGSPLATFDSGSGAASIAAITSVDQSVCPCHEAPHDEEVGREIDARPLGFLPAIRPATSRGSTSRAGLHDGWDAPGFLRDAASAARRHPEVAFRAAEIQTGQWVNDPTSIGSTSSR